MYDTRKPYIPEVLKIVRTTWEGNEHICVLGPNKYVPSRYAPSGVVFVDHPDGIGTCGVPYYQRRDWASIAKNAVAMGVNDLATCGARPYKTQVILELPQDDHEAVISIMRALSYECRERKIAIVGGETAINNTRDGVEVFLAMSGVVQTFPEPSGICEGGDVVLGLSSSGIHSNGWTRVRELFGDDGIPENFFVPTQYYDDVVLSVLEEFGGTHVRCAEHITGGAFTRLKKHLGKNRAVLDFGKVPVPEAFRTLHDRGVSGDEMCRTFNCGIGMVLIVGRQIAKNIIRSCAEQMDEEVYHIGRIETAGSRDEKEIRILSLLDSPDVIL